ncbi:hypothetical protein [Acutalibacter caecimuris]|uniref:hypothetical protein n=1 Tax=Acutalibacter caecimuris TaxID=3093657 RepID=UPI002AC98258|nr:hypothetical protein [Acutalibacter sp. M00118]
MIPVSRPPRKRKILQHVMLAGIALMLVFLLVLGHLFDKFYLAPLHVNGSFTQLDLLRHRIFCFDKDAIASIRIYIHSGKKYKTFALAEPKDIAKMVDYLNNFQYDFFIIPSHEGEPAPCSIEIYFKEALPVKDQDRHSKNCRTISIHFFYDRYAEVYLGHLRFVGKIAYFQEMYDLFVELSG